MRRLLCLVLLAVFGLPIVAPAFALGQDPDANLPVCCRRHGKHHCAMLLEALNRAHSGPQAVALCPCYPQHTVAPVAGGHLLAIHASQRSSSLLTALAPRIAAESHPRLAPAPARPSRGPPPELL